jgi:hydrogenase nickel incorporation protein HypA/HybF
MAPNGLRHRAISPLLFFAMLVFPHSFQRLLLTSGEIVFSTYNNFASPKSTEFNLRAFRYITEYCGLQRKFCFRLPFLSQLTFFPLNVKLITKTIPKREEGREPVIMHELPVVLDLLRVMDEEAKKRSLHKVSRIRLVIGELSSIIDESVQMYFEIAAKDSVCANATLEFEHRPAVLKCLKCGKEFPHEKSFSCPDCGGDATLVKGTGILYRIL